jgi:hypothetical protein
VLAPGDKKIKNKWMFLKNDLDGSVDECGLGGDSWQREA